MTGWERDCARDYNSTNKQYIYKPVSVLANEIHKILWDFEIQIDYLMLARKPNLVLINRKKRVGQLVDFAVQVDHRMKMKKR